MNRYTFEELTVGQTESYSVTVTEDMLAHFLAITGDCLIHSVETKFVKPVFVGDTLLVSGEVAEKHEHFPVIKLKVVITNQKKEKVLRGSMQIGVLKDGE